MELTRRDALALAALLVPGAAAAERELEVPYVPTAPELVEAMLDLAEVARGDYLIDLGCGDGRIAIAAARRGAQALGVDLDPNRIEEAVTAARYAMLGNLVRFRRQDLFATPIWEASVVTLYLLPAVNLRLRPRLLTELTPGSRVVSHNFDMGDWRPDADERHETGRIMLWHVPAVAEGQWQITRADGTTAQLTLGQRFQDLTGTLTDSTGTAEISGGRLAGTDIAFTAGGRRYAGVVAEGVMAGADNAWRAVRTGDS